MSIPTPKTDVPPHNAESIDSKILSDQQLTDWRGSLTTFQGFTGVYPKAELSEATWPEIGEQICPEKPALLTDKKQGDFIVPCLLKEAPLVGNTLKQAEASGAETVGKMRSKNHVTEATSLVMDIDGLTEEAFNAGLEKIKADGITYLAFSTFSNGNPQKPGIRARLVIPLDGALTIDDYEAAWHGFDQRFWSGQAGKADPSGAKLYQQQGTWCCDPSRQELAFKKSNEAGIASANALIEIGRSLQSITPALASQEKGDFPPSDANKVADNCNQIGAFRDHKGADQSEPQWLDCIGVIVHCENGEEQCQSWSSGHDGYSAAETRKKLATRMNFGPTTCDQFRKTNPDGCSGCQQTCRSPIALGRPATIDKAKNAQPKPSDTFGDKVEPYPDPVEPSALFQQIKATVQRHIILDEYQAVAVTLWIVMTWLVDSVEILPLLLINAPEKSCGKTQLLDIVGRMSFRSFTVANITTAALFRIIDCSKPTLLLDEADTFYNKKSDIAGIINAGHSRSSAFVLRLVGESHEPKQFTVWCPKAVAGIALEKHLSDATMSRGVVINMRRKLSGEQITRLRHADRPQFDEIKSKLARFAADCGSQVSEARPDLPEELSDRAQDNWEPLLAIAECAGPEWLDRARTAALKLSSNESSVSIGTEILADIQQVFETKKVEKISSADLIAALIEDEEAPWATFNRGKPISPRQLANQLNKYGIKSKTVRMKFGTPKGYDLGQFQDAFDRYLTPPADASQPENLPPRRNVLPQPMPAMDSGVADETQRTCIAPAAPATPQMANNNDADTPEPMPAVGCGGRADVTPPVITSFEGFKHH